MSSGQHAASSELVELITAEIQAPLSPDVSVIADAIRQEYGDAVSAIVFYGSCLREGIDADGILDLYVLVDRYRDFYSGPGLAVLNRLLPPNVFYMEKTVGDRILRTKYAVVSMDAFDRLTSARCFHSAFWARFAQPCALIYARDEATRVRVVGALAGAVRTFIQCAIPRMPGTFGALDLWKRGLAESYRTEIRPEPPGAVARLVQADPDRYRRVTRAVVARLTHCEWSEQPDGTAVITAAIGRWARRGNGLAWVLRRIQGKLLNLLRLTKAAVTFDGGVGYVLWKVERHTGIREELTPLARRYPVVALWDTARRLYRRGAIR